MAETFSRFGKRPNHVYRDQGSPLDPHGKRPRRPGEGFSSSERGVFQNITMVQIKGGVVSLLGKNAGSREKKKSMARRKQFRRTSVDCTRGGNRRHSHFLQKSSQTNPRRKKKGNLFSNQGGRLGS